MNGSYVNPEKGYLSIVLHAHLPYVRHPEAETYIEERWLFEAISETYLPLLINYEKLVNEGVATFIIFPSYAT